MAKDKRKKSENLPKTHRKRVLSIIYFIDSSSTRSLKIPLEYFKAGAGLFIGISLWAISSVFIIHSLVHTQRLQRSQIGKLSSIIFDYQTRYDAVYEQAYPISDRSPAASASSEPQQNPDAKPMVANTVAKVESVATPIVSPITSEEKTDTQMSEGEESDQHEEAREINIEVEKPTYKWDGKSLHMSFAIKNVDSAHRAKGNVWAVAQLTDKAGKKIFVPQPSGIRCDPQGLVQNPAKGTSFMIKRFRPFSMTFLRPTAEVEFVSVVISTIDQKNNRKDHPFEIDRAIFSGVPNGDHTENQDASDHKSAQGVSPSEGNDGGEPK